MKKILLLSLAIGFICIGCEQDDNKVKTYERITIEEAGALILNWVFADYEPEMNSGFSFDSIIELTTDEIFSNLGGQVYSAQSGVPGLQDRWLFIRERKVYDLHGYFYDQHAILTDRNNIVVTDLNGDESYELFYTAGWGSGVTRKTVNCFEPVDIPKGAGINIAENAIQCDFRLLKQSNQELSLKYIDNNYDLVIGEIQLTGQGDDISISVQFVGDIPQEVRDKLDL